MSNKTKDKLKINYQIKSNLATYKEIDESSRIIKAVVSTYNYFDYDYDVLRKGCAKKSIQNNGAHSNANDKILHALNHNLHTLPGKSIIEKEIKINGHDVLYVESFLPETTLGEDTLINYQANIYNQHSIGFRYVDIQFLEKGAEAWSNFLKHLINPEEAERVGFGYDVKEIEWFEWSTVAFGANKLTQYLGTKSANKTVQIDNLYIKMDALIKAANSQLKNKKIFELQYSQLKQLIQETINYEPSKKDTLIIDTSLNDIQKNEKKRNQLINLINNY